MSIDQTTDIGERKVLQRRLKALALATLLLLPVSMTGQGAVMDPPKAVFGTWIWNAASRSGSGLDNYTCYVERLDDMGNGRVRVRDHRIRLVKGADTQTITNDFDVMFNTPIMRGNGTSTLWRITSPRSYQLMTVPANGSAPTFVVTREISADGQKMTQVGQGVVNGVTVRSEFVFDRAEGASNLGDCAIE
jgi:hypothetical protein